MDYTHVCSLDCDRLKEVRCSFTNLSVKNPRTKLFFRSVASVRKEKFRHAQSKYRFIVHPLSMCRLYWEVFAAILLYISLLIVPISFFIPYEAMYAEYGRGWDIMQLCIDVLCMVDVLMMFACGICIESISEVVTHPKRIAKMRLRSSYFYIYLLASIPSTVVDLIVGAMNYDQKLDLNVRVFLSLVPGIKIFRTYKFVEYYDNVTECLGDKFYRKYVKYSLFFLIFVHWMTCIYIYLRLFDVNFYPEIDQTFETEQGLSIHGSSTETLYFKSLFLVVSFMFSYNLMVPYRKTINYDAISFNEIIGFLVIAIVGYTLCIVITDNLRRDIYIFSCRSLIENVSILKDLPQEIIASIVSNLHRHIFLYNDIIVKSGSIGDCMYFIANGTVAVSTPTGKEICHLQDGAYFGEIALINAQHRRMATVMAIEICEVYRLDKKDFRFCFPPNSIHFKKIEQIANERIEKTTLLEELHLKYMLTKTKRKKKKN